MTRQNQLNAAEYAPGSTAPVSVSQPTSGMGSLFHGPRGLRAGQRLVIFIGLSLVLFGGILLAMFLVHGFRIIGFALHGMAMLYALSSWAIAFFVAGLCRELLNRADLLYRLACGVGLALVALVFSRYYRGIRYPIQ